MRETQDRRTRSRRQTHHLRGWQSRRQVQDPRRRPTARDGARRPSPGESNPYRHRGQQHVCVPRRFSPASGRVRRSSRLAESAGGGYRTGRAVRPPSVAGAFPVPPSWQPPPIRCSTDGPSVLTLLEMVTLVADGAWPEPGQHNLGRLAQRGTAAGLFSWVGRPVGQTTSAHFPVLPGPRTAGPSPRWMTRPVS